MTTAATQDRAYSTSLRNNGGRSIKRLATSVYGGTFRTWLDVRVASAIRSKTDIAMVDRNSQQESACSSANAIAPRFLEARSGVAQPQDSNHPRMAPAATGPFQFRRRVVWPDRLSARLPKARYQAHGQARSRKNAVAIQVNNC